MNVFSKQRLVGAFLVGLVLLNIGLLGTIWTMFLKEPSETEPDTQSFMEQELRLTTPQAAQFESLRGQHLVGSKQLLDDIYDLKQAITAELFVAEPDIERVDDMSAQIGEKYTELELLRFQYFLDMRDLVGPEQQAQLENLMRDLLQTVKPPALPQGVQPQPAQPGQSGPPQEAIDVCRGKAEGDACQFNTPRGVVIGTCLMRDQFVCVPPDNGMPNSAREGRPQSNQTRQAQPASLSNQRPAP